MSPNFSFAHLIGSVMTTQAKQPMQATSMKTTRAPLLFVIAFLAFELSASAAVVTATYNSASDVPITAAAYKATGNSVKFTLGYAPVAGTELTVVKNTGLSHIKGVFKNLTQGQTVILNYGGVSYKFVANYYGGTGNDLVLVWKNNRLLAWGSNDAGQLGNNSQTDTSAPVPVALMGVLSGKTVLAVSAGGFHSLALCSDGSVAAWGDNSYGQLGNDGYTNSTIPVAVTATGALSGKTVVAISAGEFHNLALCSDGTLAGWGVNHDGQLGSNSTPEIRTPVAVKSIGALSGKTVVAISAGRDHNLALCSDGTVAAWGYNFYGQLGDNSYTNRIIPVAVTSIGVLSGRTVVAVSAGQEHSLALCSDGTIAAWGYDGGLFSSVPVAVGATGALSGKTVVAVSAGTFHSMALCSDGTVAAWGRHYYSQAGNNRWIQRNLPVAVTATGILAGKHVVTFSAGYRHSMALCSDGTLAAWGNNGSGQLGDNSTINSDVPIAVSTSALFSGERFTQVISGQSFYHSLALVAAPPMTPTLSAPTITSMTTPTSGLGTNVTSNVTSKGDATITERGIVFAETATNSNPSIGGTGVTKVMVTGTTAVFTAPVTGLRENTAYSFKAYAINAMGTGYSSVRTFGAALKNLTANYRAADNVPITLPSVTILSGSTANLSLGYAPTTGTQLTVVKNTGLSFISGFYSDLAQGQPITLSYDGVEYNFVVNYYGGTGNDLVLVWKNNRPLAWGSNYFGQLGNNSISYSSAVPESVTATGVLSGKTVIAVSAGRYHSLALCSDGTVAAWGDNDFGQLGNNSWKDSNVPVAVRATGVLSGKTVVAIAAGGFHSTALCSDGTVAAWGLNGSGQLGNNSSKDSNVPVAVRATGVLSGRTVVAVSAGSAHSLALCSDGMVTSWGTNFLGQLGNNSTTNSRVPVAVTWVGILSEKSIVSVAAGGYHSLALCSDGTVGAWGSNSFGLLGTNVNAANNVPVTVPAAVTATGALSGRTVVAVAAGDFHSIALCSDGTVAAWGNNGSGQLGNKSTEDSTVPVAVTATGVLSGKTVVNISAGSDHSVALCSDGTLTTWGSNNINKLGNNSRADSAVPVAVSMSKLLFGERFVQAESGQSADHTLAIAAAPPRAVPAWAVLQLSGNALPIANADSTPTTEDGTDFGSAPILNGQTTHSFSLSNMGGAPLHLTGQDSIQISGDAAADFTISSEPGSQLGAGLSTTLAITFDPSFPGRRRATVTISSNDRGTSLYTFSISGFGALSALKPQSITFAPPVRVFLNQSPISLTATATSGLPVTLTRVSGPATLVGNNLTLTGVGTVKLVASQSGGSNYATAATVTKSIVVTANPTTLTLINLLQTYDGTPKPISTLGGTSPVITYNIDGIYGTTAPTNAGSYSVKVVDGTVTKNNTLVIAKAMLTVRPDDQRKFPGQPNPILTYDIWGLQGTDTSAILTKAPVLITTASATSASGIYPITASAATALNYNFNYQPGSMVVDTFAGTYEALLVDATERPVAKLSITVPTQSKTFTAKLSTGTHVSAISFKGSLTPDPTLETATGSSTANILVNKVKIPHSINFTLLFRGGMLASAARNSAPLGSASDGRKLLILAQGMSVNYAGAHTALLEPATPAGPTVPGGTGWATATIKKSGVMTLAGKLGDGTAFTSALSPDNQPSPVYRLFIRPYIDLRSEQPTRPAFLLSSIEKEKLRTHPIDIPILTARTESYLAGAITLAAHLNLTNRRYVEQAALTWKKARLDSDATYPSGFGPVNTVLMLDPWLPPVAANAQTYTAAITLANRLGLAGPTISFGVNHSPSGSDAGANLPTRLNLTAKNRVSVHTPASNSTQWRTHSFFPTTGTFTGSFMLSDVVADKTVKRPVTFSGVLRQPALSSDVLIGGGYCILPHLIDSKKSTGEILFTRP